MNNLVLKNIRAFKNNHTFKNFILLVSLIFIFLFMILLVWNYCNIKINKMLDDESSKTIYIESINKYAEIEKILEKNTNYINSIYYNLYVNDYTIDGNTFNIISSDGIFNENIKALKMNDKWKKNNKFLDIDYDEILYDSYIDINSIYINQNLAKELVKSKNYNAIIEVKFNKYTNAKIVLNQLLEKNIEANEEMINSTIKSYQDLTDVLQTLFLIFVFCNIIIIFFISVSNIHTQSRNIYIMKVCGFSNLKIINIYNSTLFVVLGLVYITILIILFFILILLKLILNKSLFYLLNIVWIPFVITITIIVILNSFGTLINNKFEIK